MRRNFMVEMSLLVLVVIALAFGFVSNREAKEREAELKAEIEQLQNQISEWRESAVPALRAVGVRVEKRDGRYGDEVSYWALRNALNPCFNARTEWSLCKKYFGKEEEIPIQIVFKRN